MSTSDVITEVKKRGGFIEIFQKTTFEGVRNKKNGDIQKVEVSIFDAGTDGNPQERFHCVAVSEDGNTAKGNNGKDEQQALLAVHWEDLDK